MIPNYISALDIAREKQKSAEQEAEKERLLRLCASQSVQSPPLGNLMVKLGGLLILIGTKLESRYKPLDIKVAVPVNWIKENVL